MGWPWWRMMIADWEWHMKRMNLYSRTLKAFQFTPHFEIGLRNRTANMAPTAVHLPIHIPWVRKNCRRNRGKAEFRENTVSLTVLAYGTFTQNFPWFSSHPCIFRWTDLYKCVFPPFCLSNGPYSRPSIWWFVCLSVIWSTRLSFNQSICVSVHPLEWRFF